MPEEKEMKLTLENIEENIERAHKEKEQLYTRIVFLEGYISALNELREKIINQ